MAKTEVLIVGAGPTGLVLALWLTKSGVKVRIIDKAKEAGTTSRAIVIHARNLEFYQQMGIAGIAVNEGIEIKAMNLWVGGKKAGHVPFSELNVNVSPFQFMLGYPQDKQEEMLEQQLAKLGVAVERTTELISFKRSADGVMAQILKATGAIESCEAIYLAGCDGARSVVREQLGVGFPGGTYEETFYVADLISAGPLVTGEVNMALDRRLNGQVIKFVKYFMQKGKPVAAICHGPWTLIETGELRNRTLTSWPSLKTDLSNAGANWVDEEVVVDDNLITSRKPSDLPAFCVRMIECISKS